MGAQQNSKLKVLFQNVYIVSALYTNQCRPIFILLNKLPCYVYVNLRKTMMAIIDRKSNRGNEKLLI